MVPESTTIAIKMIQTIEKPAPDREKWAPTAMWRPRTGNEDPRPNTMKKGRVEGFSRNSSRAANATVAISKSSKSRPPELICVSPPRTLGEAGGAKKNPKIARNAAAPVISKPQVRRELKSILEAFRDGIIY